MLDNSKYQRKESGTLRKKERVYSYPKSLIDGFEMCFTPLSRSLNKALTNSSLKFLLRLA